MKFVKTLLRLIGADPIDGADCMRRAHIYNVYRHIVNYMVAGGCYVFI